MPPKLVTTAPCRPRSEPPPKAPKPESASPPPPCSEPPPPPPPTALVAAFLGGLLVGRTPEYLGKQVRQREITFISLYALALPATVLIGTALALALPAGRAGLLNTGPHGLAEPLYAFTSAANSNGSAFAGLNADTTFYN